MIDRISNPVLRITARYAVMLGCIFLVVLIALNIETLTGWDLDFYRGWISVYLLFWLFPSMRPWYEE